jgi:hypothetical protein
MAFTPARLPAFGSGFLGGARSDRETRGRALDIACRLKERARPLRSGGNVSGSRRERGLASAFAVLE